MTYFDNNATTKPFASVQAAHTEALVRDWPNPSAPSRASARVRAKLELAREEMAEYLESVPESLSFTSGATEANNSFFAHLASSAQPGDEVLVSAIEHPSVSEPARHWFGEGVRLLPVDSSGAVDLDVLGELLDDNVPPLCVALMAASNETGVLQPWREAALLCRKRGIHFHCDGTQWVGKLPSVGLSACDSFAVSAHKFGGPKGVGLLGSKLGHRFVLGGLQEAGRRGGTENFPAIEGMKTGLAEVTGNLSGLPGRSSWRDAFEGSMLENFSGLKVLGGEGPRLWNTSMLLMPDFEGLSYVGKLDKLGFEVSTGSACSSGGSKSSPTALAMGFSETESKRLIRVSSYLEETEEDWRSLASAFLEARDQLESESAQSTVISL